MPAVFDWQADGEGAGGLLGHDGEGRTWSRVEDSRVPYGVGGHGWCAWQVPKSLSEITSEAVESLAAALAAGD